MRRGAARAFCAGREGEPRLYGRSHRGRAGPRTARPARLRQARPARRHPAVRQGARRRRRDRLCGRRAGRLAASVVLLESDAALSASAAATVAALGAANVTVATGPLAAGHAAGAPMTRSSSTARSRPGRRAARAAEARWPSCRNRHRLRHRKAPHFPEGARRSLRPDRVRRFRGAVARLRGSSQFRGSSSSERTDRDP